MSTILRLRRLTPLLRDRRSSQGLSTPDRRQGNGMADQPLPNLFKLDSPRCLRFDIFPRDETKPEFHPESRRRMSGVETDRDMELDRGR